jgi:hypothetical protein
VQTEERSQFRLNPQAWIMVGVSVLALGLPLAGVLLFALTARFKTESPAAAADPQLTKTLEDISEKALAPKALETGERGPVRLETPDVAARAAAVTKLARSVGGSAMPASSADGEERLWVSVPEKRVPAFVEACERGTEELEYPAPGENDARVLIEIVIQQKTP